MKIVEAIPVNHPQRSEEWFQARLGHVTASEVKKTFIEVSSVTRNAMLRILLDVTAINAAVKKTDAFMELDALDNEILLQKVQEINPEFQLPESQERMNYRKKKVAEIVYGMRVDEDQYITNAMLWGQVSEEFAKTMFQLRTGLMIEEAVFKKHPTIRCGASPDGHIPSIKKKTIVEIKSLTPANHLFNVMLDPRLVIEEYYDQMQMQMWLENAEQCQFIGGDSRAPEGLKIYAEMIDRDEQRIAEIEASIIQFNKEVDRDVKKAFAVAQSYKKAGIV
jgi:hypothetical protein